MPPAAPTAAVLQRVPPEGHAALGGGLSSSASLEVAMLRALNELFALGLDASTIARLAHRVETEFVGVPVGVMDQMAVSLGTPRTALFIDTRSLERDSLPLPPAS